MGKERKCILCDIIYNSKQEMDEHMRSMLHHRELENLKGRDCDHECRVCRVSVVGLTAYASHISSSTHKQRVEAQERECAGGGPEENYFDKELVQLIKKRKEMIRKEEEAAKKAQEEEQRKQQQLNEERQWLHQQGAPWGWGYPNFPLSPKGRGMPSWRGAGGGWSPARAQQGGPWHPNEGLQNWPHGQQGQSATWHAEGPPNFQKWHPAGGSLGGGGVWGSKKKGCQGFLPQQKGKSSQSSSSNSSLYGGNRFYWEQEGEALLEGVGPDTAMDFTNDHLPLSGALHFNRGHEGNQGDYQGGGWQGGQQSRKGDQSRDRSKGNGIKAGSNTPKDKAYRWTPYPPAKLSDTLPQKEAIKDPVMEYETVPPVQMNDLQLNFDFVLGATRSQMPTSKQQRQKQQAFQSKEAERRKLRWRDSPKSNSLSKDIQTSSEQKQATPFEQTAERASSTSSPGPCSQVSRWDCKYFSSQLPGPASPQKLGLNPEQDQMKETTRKTKESLQDRRGSADTWTAGHSVLRMEEGQEVESTECKAGSQREEEPGKMRGRQPLHSDPDGGRRRSCSEEGCKKSSTSQSASTLSLQSVQVSTSTCETPGDATSSPRVEDREGENERDPAEQAMQAMQAVDEGLGSDSDVPRGGQAPAVPDLSKLGLPASLKRDLTRHMSSKGKAGAHEPNLNIARRIRNVSGTRKGEADKDSGLRPTLRQLISATGSRRNVNWDQVYQEVSRKKQEQGKGQPRFGIEMVTPVPYDLEGLSLEEEDTVLAEGYHWDSICEPFPSLPGTATPRKRSLSESSVVTDRTASALSLFTAAAPGADKPRDRPDVPPRLSSEPQGGATQIPRAGPVITKEEREPGEGTPAGQGPESVEGDSSCTSEAEQNDTQGLGKKRRAAGDIPSPEIPSLERKNKRMKIKPKKEAERCQVDQLLAVSLREEELSSSLQAVDNSLIQARANLQAAYIEVQRLLVVKQQVTMEMSTLRTKRIEILQGMQEGYDGVALPGEKSSAEASAAAATAAALLSPFSPLSDIPSFSPSHPTPATLPAAPHRATPPSSLSSALPASASTLSLHIKQEPGTTTAENPVRGLHGAAVEPCLNTSLAEPVLPKPSMCPPSLGGLRQASLDSQESVSVSSEHSQDQLRESCIPMVQAQLQERGVLVTRAGCFSGLEKPGASPHQAPLSARRRDSQTGATDHTELLTETSTSRVSVTIATDPLLPPPASSSQPDPKSGKRVRKLKKKKVLKKALGQEQPDNSDTEQDGDTSCRPIRRVKTKKKAKGARVSTSTPAPLGQQQDGVCEAREGQASPPHKSKQEGAESDSSSSLEMVELPQAAPLEVVSIDTSDPEDEPSPRASPKSPSPPSAPPPTDPVKSEPSNLACDEVSSTSELDTIRRTRAHSSKSSPPPSTEKISKNNSGAELSSEPGDDEEPTEGLFEGHQAAVNAMQIHNGQLYTCSGDRTVRAFSLVSRKCVAVFEGHSTKVNCLLVSCGPGLQQRLYTGSSDQTIRCYSLKTRECVEQMSLSDRVLCFHSRWKILYAGLANGSVVSFSLKTNRQLDVFECHGPRAVSCLASAQEGARHILLVGSYDCTISVRDAKSGLLLRTLEGHTKTVLCMKVVNDLVFSGSSDQSVHAHNIHTGELVRIYKGHSHAVTVVAILGKVMVTACLDKLVRVYELQSHDRLQVYGGHKDMVMCMAIHKSMIYTGCYDGSVQAVRLNLMQNYRCWWHGCSLIFGVMEHLRQHLLTDHTSPNFQTLKCRWKNCDAFFTVRNNSKQEAPLHMQKHAEEDSKLES
ncbi:zinc finger protein 106 [Megalops cyprinoides]|uniref:zinc finger protein 106 n=1 Tax=Megalops cyprinoides TaxID=118141 RepID=UPI001863CDFB|nr:zinc finger protein 106 [Megalops cyprinoides]